MPRKGFIARRTVLPDSVYGSDLVQKFISSMMWDGKRSTAQRIFYGALEQMGVGDLEHRGSPGDGVHKVFGRYQVGQQGGTCRAAEGTAGPDQEQHGKDRPNSMHSAQGED